MNFQIDRNELLKLKEKNYEAYSIIISFAEEQDDSGAKDYELLKKDKPCAQLDSHVKYYGFENDYDYAESPDGFWIKLGYAIKYIDSSFIFARLDSKEHKDKEDVLIRAYEVFKKDNSKPFIDIVMDIESGDSKFKKDGHRMGKLEPFVGDES